MQLRPRLSKWGPETRLRRICIPGRSQCFYLGKNFFWKQDWCHHCRHRTPLMDLRNFQLIWQLVSDAHGASDLICKINSALPFWCGRQLCPLTSQIEEELSHIQPAPCFGRSVAGWQVSSKVLITVGNQYGQANLRCSSSDLSQSNYSRSFSNADWTSRPSTRFCFQKPARTHSISLSKLLFTSARSSLDFSPIVVWYFEFS